ncbi:MAG: TetM/TetW/TetO/TetS family tetracycline resistance ribosomal protection protein [Lachnospiraceae bacterium]|nr:TetM/TetW/TetO/TetS family tetracycline resistance ribosomal protection protein [Lachnospiraceae bacterium]
MKKDITIAVLAHVDAGKTTLSEALLYESGAIRKIGRVDHKDAYLDTDDMERERGITIYAKQARLELENYILTLLDTPGHVDFSVETERVLCCLDYAILLVSAADGVQGHTRTLWQLLKRYNVPLFIFVNKMDQPGMDAKKILANLKMELSGECVDFMPVFGSGDGLSECLEEIAMSDEKALDDFLSEGDLSDRAITELVARRKVFPVIFGSALKLEGINELVSCMNRFMKRKEYGEEFSARVYKISRDAKGARLTHLKVTGGTLKVRSVIGGIEEKVNQIRLYSGDRFETADEVSAGGVCAVLGPLNTYPGMGLGAEENDVVMSLEPVMVFKAVFDDKISPLSVLSYFKELEEEQPELHVIWNEKTKEIQIQMMGEVQIEILTAEIKKRYDLDVEFKEGTILYKETIANTVIGIGHFEPLRHYAEVHLVLEPLERGSGLVFETDCSEEILAKNWQRLVLTHLKEREHRGVLLGAPITDMKISLVAGAAHIKHTEGGDFRQATYRAVRQGLMQAVSVLLEPYYRFRLDIPEEFVGRAMNDIDRMSGKLNSPEIFDGKATLTGKAPVSTIQGYQKEVLAYTGGRGSISLVMDGYDECHNPTEVLADHIYDPNADLRNPSASVFCAHGAGYLVEWDMVPMYAHIDSGVEILENSYTVDATKNKEFEEAPLPYPTRKTEEIAIGTDEIDSIINSISHANSNAKKNKWKKTKVNPAFRNTSGSSVTMSFGNKNKSREEYLLVDGYNIIFAWEELSELAKTTIDGARGRLLDIMSNYQGIKKINIIVVFDAYRLKEHPTEIYDYHNVHVVFTKEAETADQYIEKFAHEYGKKYKVTVATSDGIEQIIIRGQGCLLTSARELENEIKVASKSAVATFKENSDVSTHKHYLFDSLDEDTRKALFSSYSESDDI